jgi:hypothetical protein
MGNIYFVAADGAIKIGYSADVSKRMAQLQTGAACKLRLLAIQPGATIAVEKRLHEEFKVHRLEGEWFRDHRTIRRYALAVSQGANPVSAVAIHALAEIARQSRDEPKKRKERPTEIKRRAKVSNRPVTPIPCHFIGTPQGDLIATLDEMTRDPDLPIYVYGRAHAALRKALLGIAVDIPKAADLTLQ